MQKKDGKIPEHTLYKRTPEWPRINDNLLNLISYQINENRN